MSASAESRVEPAALGWLDALRYEVLHESDVAAEEPGARRGDLNDRGTASKRRLHQALVRPIPGLPREAVDDASSKFARNRVRAGRDVMQERCHRLDDRQ